VIRNPDSLTTLSKIRQIVLDKTGTITYGKLAVNEVIEIASNRDEIIGRAAAVEKLSSHPIAKAIADLDDSYSATDAQETAGFGISAVVDGTRVTVSKTPMWKTNPSCNKQSIQSMPRVWWLSAGMGWLKESSPSLTPSGIQPLRRFKS